MNALQRHLLLRETEPLASELNTSSDNRLDSATRLQLAEYRLPAQELVRSSAGMLCRGSNSTGHSTGSAPLQLGGRAARSLSDVLLSCCSPSILRPSMPDWTHVRTLERGHVAGLQEQLQSDACRRGFGSRWGGKFAPRVAGPLPGGRDGAVSPS